MRLVINLFGGFVVTHNDSIPADNSATDNSAIDHAIPFATDRARALLAYLAVEADQPHRREALAALLWPDDQETSARQNLSQTLTRLRRAIGDYDTEPPYVQITRPTLQLNRAAYVTVDLLDFQNLFATCASHVHNDNAQEKTHNDLDLAHCDACIERLVAAIDLYRGPFLDGTQLADSDTFEEWVLLTHQQTQRQALDALDVLTTHYAARDEQRLAQQYAARQLAIEPWRESAHCQLMLALAHNGQRGAALAQFDSCRRLLADELAVEPEAATRDLAEKIRAGEIKERDAGAKSEGDDAQTAHHSPLSSTHLAPAARHLTRSRLEPKHDQHLFGVAAARAQVQALLQAEARPWIIAIDGIGGIGKTTLATALAHEFIESDRFADIGWISAKQEEFEPAVGRQSTGRPALDTETLTDNLLIQLLEQPPLTATPQEKEATLLQLLKSRPYLVIIDNLESVADQESLTPYLRQLANPTKFLLTTRFSRQAHAEVYSHTLCELSETDTLSLLRHEAEVRGIDALAQAQPKQLSAIYRVVGGNPLALKMVVGQVGLLPLNQILTNLEEARGKRVEELYTYIYWQAWQLLNLAERQLLLSMPLVPDGTFDHLTLACGLDEEPLQEALTSLIHRSLVQVTGDLTERRYRLHLLTETFLMNEVLKWQATV